MRRFFQYSFICIFSRVKLLFGKKKKKRIVRQDINKQYNVRTIDIINSFYTYVLVQLVYEPNLKPNITLGKRARGSLEDIMETLLFRGTNRYIITEQIGM